MKKVEKNRENVSLQFDKILTILKPVTRNLLFTITEKNRESLFLFNLTNLSRNLPFTITGKKLESLLLFNLTNFTRNLPFTITEKIESLFISNLTNFMMHNSLIFDYRKLQNSSGNHGS